MEKQTQHKLSFWLSTPFRRLYIRHFESDAQRDARLESEWEAKGCPVPPPHPIKRKTVRKAGKSSGIRTLVETGTFQGDMIAAMLGSFDEIHSIELLPEFYQRAIERFKGKPNVHLYEGDSGQVIGEVLQRINRPAVFWLDGHYSGEGTAIAAKSTPIVEELEAIAADPHAAKHVILIDDAHCFTGENDYPTLERLEEMAKQLGFGNFSVEHNIIRLSSQSALFATSGTP